VVLAAIVSAANEPLSTLTLVDATRVAMERNPELAEASSSAAPPTPLYAARAHSPSRFLIPDGRR